MYDKRSAWPARRARAGRAQLQIQLEARLTPDAFAEAVEAADCLVRVEQSQNPLIDLFGEAHLHAEELQRRFNTKAMSFLYDYEPRRQQIDAIWALLFGQMDLIKRVQCERGRLPRGVARWH